MHRSNNVEKINNLKVNFACFGLGVVLTTATFAGYNLVNSSDDDIVYVEFEKIDNTSEVKEDKNFKPTHYTDIVSDELVMAEHEYSGMALDNEFEDYIRSLCNKYASIYGLDADLLFKSTLVIGDQESNGTWDSNGKISPTDDYGEFQINISNHENIRKNLGYTTDELLNDKEKNADAAIWIISNIMVNNSCQTDEDIYGMYNGWINWESKEESVEYVASCLEREDTYFGKALYLTKR